MQKAKRSLAKLKLGISGVSGSGKTMGSLLIAYGLLKGYYPNLSDSEIWNKVCLIDTENNSGSLYANMQVGSTKIGEFNTIALSAPYSPERYIEAITCAENAGIELVIIDSLTHAWAGEGGSLDKQGAVASRSGNSYTAWREVTPAHNKLVNKLIQSPLHIIATVRSKTDYAMSQGANGKNVVTKLGLAPIFRDGIEYEFTTMLEVDSNHLANASKDRTAMFRDDFFTITENTGKMFYSWLMDADTPSDIHISRSLKDIISSIDGLARALCENATPSQRESVAATIKSFLGTANYNLSTDTQKLLELETTLTSQLNIGKVNN